MNRGLRIGLLFAFSGCTTAAPLPSSVPLSPKDGGPYAGVAEVDITPPPGLSLFGHGPEGRVSAGFRLRLRCQAFVLRSREDVVALVPCDLAAPAIELQRAVAARLLAREVPM